MEVLLDIIRSFDYEILTLIAEHWRGGLSDTVWTLVSLLGNGGALWIITALALLFFRKTRRAGAAMLAALLNRPAGGQCADQGVGHAAAAVCHPCRPDRPA